MIDRRAFLRAFGLGAAAAVAAPELLLDPERALWVPGQKTIFLPAVEVFNRYGNTFITPQWITREVVRQWQNNLKLASCINRQYEGALEYGGEIVSVMRPSFKIRVR